MDALAGPRIIADNKYEDPYSDQWVALVQGLLGQDLQYSQRPHEGGQNWTPIPLKTESMFHAE
jgi:hypothetical protein